MTKKGNELYELLVRLGGMDRVHLEREMNRLLHRMGLDSGHLTMADIRRVAVTYLEELNHRVQCHSPLKMLPRVKESLKLAKGPKDDDDLAEA